MLHAASQLLPHSRVMRATTILVYACMHLCMREPMQAAREGHVQEGLEGRPDIMSHGPMQVVAVVIIQQRHASSSDPGSH